jgi:uncharacterized protein
MVKLIERSLRPKLIELLSYFPAVGLVGARQVGKTTLAKSMGGDTMYLDLEDDRDRAKLEYDPQFFFQQFSDKTCILDEVQQMPEIFKILRGVIDSDRRSGRFILLGSASPILLKQSSESLTGRIAYLDLRPLFLSETLHLFSWQQLWLRGGFPESVLAPSDTLSMEWRRSFIRAYTERDLPMLGLNANPQSVLRFWQMLAGDHGGVWQTEKYANSLSLSQPIIKNYLEFLEHAYLVERLYPWFPNVTKRLVKSPKVYISDSGLLHALLQIGSLDILLGTSILGASWEGFVIRQIKTAIQGKLSCYFYRTQQGAECDLVLVSGEKPIVGIEIKFGSKPNISRGFYTSLDDLGTTENYVLIPEGSSYLIRPGVRVVSVTDFLVVYLPTYL